MSVKKNGKIIAGTTTNPSLFDYKWADHLLDAVSWLRSDTYSWQDGDVYKAAYNHLVADWDAYWEGKDPDVPSNWQSETINGIEVSFITAADGHKICYYNQETAVQNLFASKGVAWYYILDKTNKRFKLPRSKDTDIKEVYNGTDGITILSNGLVIQRKPNRTGTTWSPNMNLVDAGRSVGAAAASYGAAYAGERTLYFGTDWNGTTFTSHSASNSTGASGTLYGAILISYATDAQITTFLGYDFRSNPAKKYLYFYVGNFTQTALENTAGITAETLNNKVDKGHQVVEFQAPTAGNNYTWYRKYADGWVEQGGRTTLNSGISSSNKQITFPVEMANNSYYANVSQDANAGAQLVMHGWQHTTYMTIGTNSVTSTGYVEWEVKGVAA